MATTRPELMAPPEIFYGEEESSKYTNNSRIIEIQTEMTERACELALLGSAETSGPKLVLDVGCGSGLSGSVLEEMGHFWVGVDISEHMLRVAQDREVEGETCLSDMGEGVYFRPGTFDACISISALQWLCNADKSWHDPRRRMKVFFQSLYNCLAKGARAIFQFYPDGPEQIKLLTSAAYACGFTGGIVVDFPNSAKAKKYYLCLFAGAPVEGYQLPKAKTDEEGTEADALGAVHFASERRSKRNNKKIKVQMKDKDWVLKKKEQQRQKGQKVRDDTKFTGRKRRPKF